MTITHVAYKLIKASDGLLYDALIPLPTPPDQLLMDIGISEFMPESDNNDQWVNDFNSVLRSLVCDKDWPVKCKRGQIESLVTDRNVFDIIEMMSMCDSCLFTISTNDRELRFSNGLPIIWVRPGGNISKLPYPVIELSECVQIDKVF